MDKYKKERVVLGLFYQAIRDPGMDAKQAESAHNGFMQTCKEIEREVRKRRAERIEDFYRW